MEAPELTQELTDRMVEGTKAQAGNASVKQLEQLRDDCLIGIMRTLRQFDVAAGRVLAEDEARDYARREFRKWESGAEIGTPLSHYEGSVQPEWVDYNGHMSESYYLLVFGDASDALFRYIGIDEDYRNAGKSFYTVETHINYYKEAATGDPLRVTTQLLGLDEKRLHFFHSMYHGDSGDLLATTEQMLLHVDMKAAKASPIDAGVYEALQAIMAVHADMARPKEAGRQMAVSPKS